LKKMDAAGDITATEITTACRRPSAPCRKVGVAAVAVGAAPPEDALASPIQDPLK
jgi:hypothetical protein